MPAGWGKYGEQHRNRSIQTGVFPHTLLAWSQTAWVLFCSCKFPRLRLAVCRCDPYSLDPVSDIPLTQQLWGDWEQPELVELTDLDLAHAILTERDAGPRTREDLDQKLRKAEDDMHEKVIKKSRS